MPKYHEISEAVSAAQQKRHQYKNDCLEFAKHQIDSFATHVGWPHELICFAQPGVPKESHEWRPGFNDSVRVEDGELTVGLRFETQRGHRIFSRMSVRKIDDVFVVTIAGVSKAITGKGTKTPHFWDSVSVALKILAESAAP